MNRTVALICGICHPVFSVPNPHTEFVPTLTNKKFSPHGSAWPFAGRLSSRIKVFAYIAVKKNTKSKSATLAKRLAFDSYYSFILTDFFEGLHYGHYPRRCEICGRYFLMQSARRQKYCPYGIAPELYRGRKITCRKYAAVLNRKEKAENDPIVSLYNRRCSAIRTECGRGTITKDFAEAAKQLAKEHKQEALNNDKYAKEEYRKAMSRAALYAEADRKIK